MQKSFDVNQAECAQKNDKRVLLDSIRSRFAKNQKTQSDTQISDPLGIFNRKVQDLLGEQIMSSSGKILQYSMTVSAFVLRWAGQDVLYGSLPDTDVPLIDHTLFVGPIPQKPLNPSSAPFDGPSSWDMYWWSWFITIPYTILVRYPLLFWVQTLIIKAFFKVEVAIMRAAKSLFGDVHSVVRYAVMCLVCVPAVFCMAVWEMWELWMFADFIFPGSACLFHIAAANRLGVRVEGYTNFGNKFW